MVAIAVAVFRFTFQNQVQNVDFRVGPRLKRRAGRQNFLIEHAQRCVAQQFRVEVVAKGKGVAGLQPAEVCLTALFGCSGCNHLLDLSLH